ncbi:tetratricopeptide repeat protein [Brevundimonas naejangsanensis]|uniref:Tetratricopeptide repeat protein n=1 Tax=Brevundimonas naejangsanensis TaxID=588932 RepID=A0A494RN46_9CAUL|nr:tetratricopeptide repeat protein [Brevundimonas naejangsanensis]AYG94876.1 tetratricopeptide repeat protein [Brevundimonas naejangsanensis]
MLTGLAVTAALWLAGPDMTVPASCQVPLDRINYRTCADEAPVGSPARSWALINLGSQAFMAGDMARAVKLYDEARPADGLNMYSDPVFHAFRGAAYDHVGRSKEALADAQTSWDILSGAVTIDPQNPPPTEDEYHGFVLAFILPILKANGDPAFAPAFGAYQRLSDDGVEALIRRAALLEQLGDFSRALAAGEKAMKLRPDDPGLQNNHCYTLVRAGRAAEGLPYCEAALARLPEASPILHSYASALAALGRCEEAERQLAEARRLDPAAALYRQPLECRAAG